MDQCHARKQPREPDAIIVRGVGTMVAGSTAVAIIPFRLRCASGDRHPSTPHRSYFEPRRCGLLRRFNVLIVDDHA